MLISSRPPGGASATAILQGLARLITWCAAQGSLSQVLTELVHFIEHLEPDVRASVQLVDREHGVLRHGAGPSLPAAYSSSIDGSPFAEGQGSCGTAVARQRRVVVTDIATDPLWVNYRDLALPHGLRACWSAPFFDGQGCILGTFAMYYTEPRGPTEAESTIIDLAASIAGVLVEKHRDTERLREREARLHAIVDNEPECVKVTALDGRLLQMNPAGLQMLDAEWHQVAGQIVTPIVVEEHRAAYEEVAHRAAGGEQATLEFDIVSLKGARRTVEMTAVPLRDAQGAVTSVLGLARDVTARRRAEAAILESKNLESIGRLAGGVAHDFNNMLSAILGYTELALEELPSGGIVRDRLEEVRKAAHRSAELTRQLLAFARRETARPRVVDLNGIVTGLHQMMRRLIGEHIELACHASPDLWHTEIDPSQVDQILTNLLVNARDAIVGDGHVTIETANVHVDAAFVGNHPEACPGDFACLTVTDTGTGMSPATLSQIFEPFFTTKDKGTGLGLATVYGSVRQNDGFVLVESVPGVGSSFRVYLPRTDEPLSPGSGVRLPAAVVERTVDTVLLAEDEPSVLELARTVLESRGYRVYAFRAPGEAVTFIEDLTGPVDLLVTDVMMPGMTGRELARHVQARRPDVSVLYMSGYPADIIASEGVLEPGVEFLQKPFTVATLVGRVGHLLAKSHRRH